MTRTNSLTHSVIMMLSYSGFKVWRNNNGAVYDPKRGVYRKNRSALHGIPDILGYHKKTGRMIAIEIKTGKDKLSPAQKIFLDELNDAGGIALEVRNITDLPSSIWDHKKVLRKFIDGK